MELNEVRGDLFNVAQGWYLAHCISADFALGAGIAKQFDEAYNMRYKLFKNYPGRSEHIGGALRVDNVFNLVTKERYFQKPTYGDLTDALFDMKRQCEKLDIDKLAMPRIGCGLDKLDWNKVKGIIEDVFGDMDISIAICLKEG